MRTVVFDIDTQRDFMQPDGRLCVPGAEQIVPTVRRILDAAEALDWIARSDRSTPTA